jgi:hypothetical protein
MSTKNYNGFPLQFGICLALFGGLAEATPQDPATDLSFAPAVNVTRGQALRTADIDEVDGEILYERQVHLPFTNMNITLLKVRDARTGEEQRVVLDQNLQPVDYEELMAIEEGIRKEIYGTMHPDLHRRINQGSLDALIDVMIKVNAEEEFVDKSAVDRGTMTDAQLRTRSNEITQDLEERAKQLMNNVAQRNGMAPVVAQEVDGPFIIATVRAQEALALSRDEGIVFIGPVNEVRLHDAPDIPESLPTTRTNSAHSYSKGSGIKIAVLESGQTTTSQSCFRVSARHTASGGTDSHMTKSLGIIGSKYNNGACNGSWVGYAPQASILMANSSSYTSSYSWAKGRGVDVVTMSWHYPSEETTGSLHSRDEYFDYWTTRYPYPMIFTSAGNQAGGGAYSSGKGYNFFGVGNVLNDGDGNRCDDTISASSSWKDPISSHSDREIPEIAAPGSTHELLGTTFGGTSCATPVAASIATCLIGANTSLRTWPEGLRAVMQATANFQQADGSNFSTWSDGKDGTGMLDAWYAVLACKARANNTSSYFRAHDYGYISNASFTNGYMNETWKVKTGTTNSKIRVAFTWNSKTTSSSSVLDADLDLRVYAPNGSLVATSSSYDNNNEFVEFTPPMTGSYTIKVRCYSAPSNFSSYFGVAFTTMYDCL